MRPKLICLFAVVPLLALPARALDLDLYAQLLERHTRSVDDLAGTRVDYAALASSADWRRLVASLDGTDVAGLGGRDEKLAFWINVYNILAIETVARNWPVESIRDVGSLLSPVWKKTAGRVGGRAVTLDQVEHEIVRPLGDPRAHAAVVCASTSCPSLRREPYEAARLGAQLDDAMRRWLASPGKGLRIDRNSNTVWLSKIFDWFPEDFEAAGGALVFATRYAPESERAWLRERGASARVRYLDYDWAVNAASL